MKRLLILITILCLSSVAHADLTSDGTGHAEGIAGGIGSGGAGVTLTDVGSTWTKSGGSVYNTPTEGAEALTDGGLETWASATDLTSWTETIAGTSTINREATIVHGGTYSANINQGATPGDTFLRQATVTSGLWYKMSSWIYTTGSGLTVNFSGSPSIIRNPGTTWTQYALTGRATSTSAYIDNGGNTAGLDFYADDVSLKPLTLSTLFLTAPLSTANVLASVEITKTGGGSDGLQAGIVTNLDSAASPTNFIIFYMAGDGTCKTDKNVAGTYTNIISAACTYSAGKELVAKVDQGAVRLYYNSVLVGTATVADAGIISNKIHGLFSTGGGSAQVFDDFVVYPRGTDGEFAILNQFVN